ncbi:MAG TPA: hypothetical protein VK151_03670 [Fluviicola sp.]|nr:hypothetical protein [Fluviicola sp.]
MAIILLSGCFVSQPFHPQDKANKKQLKCLPESETIFIAKYAGTQTGSQVSFRKDRIFVLQTQTAFGWEQYNGQYHQIDGSDTFSLTYLNDHAAKWNYMVIDGDLACLKLKLNDTTPANTKTLRVTRNLFNQ